MLKVGVIGFGYWGPNLVRNFISQKKGTIKSIAEYRVERHQIIKDLYPAIEIFQSADEIINDTEIDAVVIATPVYSHFELAKKSLLAGKHVLLEKPMASSVKECEELINLASQLDKILMVDHTFLYTGAVQKMKEIIENDSIGKLKYFDSTRINLGLFQSDINVLWDLAPHDISILNHLIKFRPYSVNATGVSHTKNNIENIAYLTINYENDFIAHFNCSWTSPVKVRSTLIGGDKKMIVYNDLEPSDKVRVYDTGYDFKSDDEKQKIMVDYRTGDVYIPKVDLKEALFGVAEDFLTSILNNSIPVANSNIGLEVVKILEASQKSIKNQGKEIVL